MSQKKSIIVNLAASHVSISAFRAESSRLFLDKFYAEELLAGLSDDEWMGSAMAAVGRLVAAHKISGSVTVVAPSFLLLQKTLKVPQVEAARQAQIIAFEAQNNIPYPLNEVVWDSQVMSSDGVEAEVLLFALRVEVATRIANAISATGLSPSAIQVAPLLDAQAAQLHGGYSSEEVLIVNVGARTTDLSFVGPAGANLQSANIGGNILTQGISDNSGQPFAAAEALKIAYFTGQVRLAEGDPQLALIQTNAQGFNRRLAQDLNRRLINIRRGTAGRQPTRILITGRASAVPGLNEQLTETLRLPVELFDPSTVVSLGSGLSPDVVAQYVYQISEVIGEAARLVLPQLKGINLIPREISDQISFDGRKPFLVAAALLVALAPFPVWLALNDARAYDAQQVSALKAKSKELTGYQSSIKSTRDEANAVLATNQQLEFVTTNSANWPLFLADLQTRVAASKNTWIEEIHVRREQSNATPIEGAENQAPDATPTTGTRVIVTARTLLDKVAPGKPFNAQELIDRQGALMTSLKQSPFVEEIPTDEIKPDYKEANVPKIIFTIVIRKEKAL